jgi:hypothetical protein
MNVIRALFEEAVTAVINTDGKVEFPAGEAVFSPSDVLRTDRIAYQAEFRSWVYDTWLEGNRSRLETILKYNNNRQRFNDLLGPFQSSSLVPIVGSGMSADSKLPTWKDFLEQLRCRTSMTQALLLDLLGKGKYEEAVEQIAGLLGKNQFDELIEHGLRIEDRAQVAGPVRLLPQLFTKLAVTTNLDDVLEYVYDSASLPFAHKLYGSEIERYRQLHARGERCLLKIHGDCRSSRGRVLSVEEYEQAYGYGATPRDALLRVYSNYALLWLGSSLNTDRTMQVAIELATVDNKLPKHFAFMQRPWSDDQHRDRERFLTDRGIYPVWYDGDHSIDIEALLIGLLDKTQYFDSDEFRKTLAADDLMSGTGR